MITIKGHIALEGIEYAGKGTVSTLLRQARPEFAYTREPGGTPVGEVLRSLMKHEHNVFDEPSVKSLGTTHGETLLMMMASRSVLTRHVTQADTPFLWDRCIISSYVYQVLCNGVSEDLFWCIADELNIGIPEHVFVLSCSYDEFCRRKGLRGEEADPLGSHAAENYTLYTEKYLHAVKEFNRRGVCQMHIIRTDENPETAVKAILDILD